MEHVLNVTLPFFAVVGCGYLAARIRLIPENAVGALNAFVWYFALPCLIFRAIALNPVSQILDPVYVAGWAIACWAVYIITASLGRLLYNAPLGVMLLQGHAASLSNVGYMGIPLLVALIDERAAIPAILGMLTNQLLLQTPTLALMEFARNRKGNALVTVRKVLKGFLINPLVLSTAVGVAVAALAVPIPVPVDSFTGFLGQAAGPAALFSIGAKLAEQPVTTGFNEAAFLAAAKLFLHPLAVWLVMAYLIGLDHERLVVSILAAALPIGGNAFVLAQIFDQYASRISSAILISTIGSTLTFAVLAAFLLP